MGKKILIVEDEADVQQFLRRLFEDHGYETCTATNGIEAEEVLERERPDLVTLDLMMPKETGTTFYRKISKDDAFKHLPFIVISALAGRHLALREPVAVFDKPIDREKLLEAVEGALR